MSYIHFRFVSVFCQTLFLLVVSVLGQASTQPAKEELFKNVVAGSDCKQTLNNGLICEYKVGQSLRFSIKDAGGRDQVSAFRHSNWDDDYYAVMYFGCIVVVPGTVTTEKYDGDGVYIAPKSGRVYRTRHECQAANK
jgi:hypothetical protein